MPKYTFTDEEIKQVEKILIDGNSFIGKRRKILENFDENIEIQACPGSGKTTLLVAKIFLLAQKINFSEESVCILTHTNVAVDEIKKKIKTAREEKTIDNNFLDNIERILKFPNYIGTLQSFIDKYLAIPGYIKFYKKRPIKIDNDYSEGFLKRGFYNNLKEETKKYLSSYKSSTVGLEKFLGTIYNPITDLLHFHSTNSGKIQLTKPENEKYKEILKIHIEKVKNEGLLSFQEANCFAENYLEKYNFILRKYLQNKFNFLFLDEIQDTSGIHINILNTLFSNSSCIIQGFGDNNQAILNSEDNKIGFKLFNRKENIDSSRRLSKEIANAVWKCAIEPQPLEGIEKREIPVYFYIYKNGKEEDLLKFYEEKIIEYNLEKIKNPIFKIIGRTHEGIKKYNSDYVGKEKTKKENFLDYFNKISVKDFKEKGFKLYKDEIIDGIIRLLNISKIKNGKKGFSKRTFIEYLQSNNTDFLDELLLNIYNWSIKIIIGDFDYNKESKEIKEFLGKLQIDSKKINFNDKFFKDGKYYIKLEEKEKKGYLKIDYGTIHSVKGETHTGTLILDISFKKENNIRILEHIFDDSIKNKKGPQIQDSIKLYYVGMTRATHLLVIGIKEENLKKQKSKLDDFKKVSDNIFEIEFNK